MRIHTIKIDNYRSIKNASFNISDYTILVGKNNHGKTNVLRAIEVFFELVNYYYKESALTNPKRFSLYTRNLIDVRRDMYAKAYNAKSQNNTIKIEVGFKLDPDEIEEINESFVSSSYTDGSIYVSFEISKDMNIDIKVKIKENGKSISKKNNKNAVLRFIQKRFSFNYIPSIRTDKDSLKLITNLIESRFRTLDSNPQYREALDTLSNIQDELLKEISNKLDTRLKKYLPGVKKINIESSREQRFTSFRYSYNINIDDGIKTELEAKGDGIKSLVAISLFHNQNDDKNYLIMIDEPEAHLHSGAIKELKKTLQHLSLNTQVLISSHNQLFVDRYDISNNIIVGDGKVRSAASLRELRNTLNVDLSENLLNTEKILFMEGETDIKIFKSFINKQTKDVKSLFDSNVISLHSLAGTKNIKSQSMLYNSLLCEIFAFLDNDHATKEIIVNIKSYIDAKHLFLVPLDSKTESEIEDLINPEIYSKIIKDQYGVDISNYSSYHKKDKWSERIKKTLETQGKLVTKENITLIKQQIANSVSEYKDLSFLNDSGITVFNSLLKWICKISWISMK